MLKVWSTQDKRTMKKDFTFWDFAVSFKSGIYAKPESIRRTRQKLQEENPDLRGKKYELRQQEAEKTRESINK